MPFWHDEYGSQRCVYARRLVVSVCFYLMTDVGTIRALSKAGLEFEQETTMIHWQPVVGMMVFTAILGVLVTAAALWLV